jgi:hypothetical protein
MNWEALGAIGEIVGAGAAVSPSLNQPPSLTPNSSHTSLYNGPGGK